MLGIVRSNVLQLLFKSLVLVWSERMDSLDADTLHKQGSSADSVFLVNALVGKIGRASCRERVCLYV